MGASMYKMSEQGNLDAVRSLVNRGVDVNKVDHYGNSALMSAGRWGREDVVLYLLSKGANINTQNNFGYTALMEAARYGQYDMVKLLVSKGAGITGYIQNDNLTAPQLCPIQLKGMIQFLHNAAMKEVADKKELEEKAAEAAVAIE
jgi:ankyrin repeat protein